MQEQARISQTVLIWLSLRELLSLSVVKREGFEALGLVEVTHDVNLNDYHLMRTKSNHELSGQ